MYPEVLTTLPVYPSMDARDAPLDKTWWLYHETINTGKLSRWARCFDAYCSFSYLRSNSVWSSHDPFFSGILEIISAC